MVSRRHLLGAVALTAVVAAGVIVARSTTGPTTCPDDMVFIAGGPVAERDPRASAPSLSDSGWQCQEAGE